MSTVAYVDTSCMVALAFGERGSSTLRRRFQECDRLVSPSLLEARFAAALTREGVTSKDTYLSAISWVVPDRRLTDEISQVLQAGYVRGADCWNLASALYVSPTPNDIFFLTLDEHQPICGSCLGFSPLT